MNQNYYPIDFQAQYEETSQKMLQISKKYRDRIISMQPQKLDGLEQELQTIQNQIQDRDLQFRKQSIYSQFASGQLMAEKRKQTPEMCPECGEELKKPIQCELCAQLFCKKCCSRNRVIPFVSKELRLCCEQCHSKFVKLFHNKQFYEEKEKLVNVINFVRNKTLKIAEKIAVKSKEVEDYKNQKRNQKIKEKNMESKVQQEEKKLRQLEDQFRKVVSEKAQKMKEEERRRLIEEEERLKARAAEEERKKREEEQTRKQELKAKEREKQEEQLQRLRQLSKLREIEKLSQTPKKDSQKQIQAQTDSLKKKEEQIRRREEQLHKREQELKKFQEQQKIKNQKIRKNSNQSNNSKAEGTKSIQTPKQSLGKNSEKDKFIDTADSKSISSSKGEHQDMPIKMDLLAKKSSEAPIQKLARQQSTKSTSEVKYSENIANVQEKKEQPVDVLQKSLANMFKPKKQDDSKSISSYVSRASKSVLDMSVNELLGARIPNPSRTSSKQQTVPIQQNRPVSQQSDHIEQQILSPTRRQVQRPVAARLSQPQEQIHEQQIKIHRDSILRNSSLITSAHKQQPELVMGPEKKCACEIM